MKINASVEGVAPLLMNRYAGGDEDVKKGKAKMKKTYVPEDEAEKSCYRTSDKKLFLPSTHFKASMVKAAVDFKITGKKTYKDYIKAGIFIEPVEIILDQQEYIIHEEPVVIQRARVLSWRPRFNKWTCNFTIEITDDMINPTVLKEILEEAGKHKGVGDHRPEYGRFKITNWKVIEN